LTCFQREPFDLVFMDWQMPELDGLEVTRRIRRIEGDTRHTPIVALTANAAPGFRETCLAAGVDDYLSKPYTESALAAVLGYWLPQPAAIPNTASSTSAESHVHLDRNALLGRYRQDHALVDELIAVFLSTAAASLDILRRGLTQGDHETCRKEAHALRGAAASVLARTLQSLAGELENRLQTPNCHDAGLRLLEIEEELARIRTSLMSH
jgi:CheY-like chemotaxis protein